MANLSSDPVGINVTPAHFLEHLEVLRRIARPKRLADMGRAVRNGQRPARWVAMTFDDGYAEVLHTVAPILQRYDFPATFFITTSRFSQTDEFYWDELQDLLLQRELPDPFHLTIGAHTVRAESTQLDSERRAQIYHQVHDILKPLPPLEFEAGLAAIRKAFTSEPRVRETYRLLTESEVLQLHASPDFEIGAHTVTHPLLAVQTVAVQEQELSESKAALERLIGERVNSFAYPYGLFTKTTAEIARRTGYSCACSIVPEPVLPGSDCYALPRIMVGDWDGDEFEKRIRWAAFG